jgi:hypothetical protein
MLLDLAPSPLRPWSRPSDRGTHLPYYKGGHLGEDEVGDEDLHVVPPVSTSGQLTLVTHPGVQCKLDYNHTR